MEEKMKKKLVLIAVITMLIAMMALTGCGSNEDTDSTASGDMIPCKIGYWGGTCEAPIYIANELGYFKECGVNPELFVISEDTTTLMAKGELDCYELTPDQFMPIKNGMKVKIIDSLHKGCIQGAATVESGIKSVKDLEGKKVGITNQGEICQIQVASQMVKEGCDPDKVEWLNYPNAEKQLAMEKGEIDAFVSYDPFAEMAVNDGHVKFFSNTFDDGLKEYLCCFIGLNETAMEKYPELAERLSAAFKMACDYLEKEPKAAAELIMEKEYITGDSALNAKLIDDYTWIAGDEEVLYDSAEEIWRQIYRAGALDEEISESELDSWIGEMVNKMVVYKGK
ncbi:ABC transporter substrate-binding protein [bacterium 210820-DFI.6.37]|nr:ABC transporter substrate-binding protein [bacterium 210820-DFI.6.37]